MAKMYIKYEINHAEHYIHNVSNSFSRIGYNSVEMLPTMVHTPEMIHFYMKVTHFTRLLKQ